MRAQKTRRSNNMKGREGVGYAFSSRTASSGRVQWEVLNKGETLEGSMNGVNFFAQLVNYGYGDESDEWEMFAYVLDPTDPYNEDAIWDSRGDADDPKTLNESGTIFRMRGVDYGVLDEYASYLYGLAVEAVGGKAKASQMRKRNRTGSSSKYEEWPPTDCDTVDEAIAIIEMNAPHRNHFALSDFVNSVMADECRNRYNVLDLSLIHI